MMNFLGRLKKGLSRSSSRLTESLSSVFTQRPLDQNMLDDLEDVLLGADLGPSMAKKCIVALAQGRFGKHIGVEEVKQILAHNIASVLEPVAKPLPLLSEHKPCVFLIVGVNGVGKTTTIGKLAEQFKQQGRSVMVVAGDTFRAAAVDQLRIWAQRSDVALVAGQEGADPAAVTFTALDKAIDGGIDVVLIDTAGRLHNKSALMDELQKVVRTIKKKIPSAPHFTLLILDGTTGQNGLTQAKTFKDMVDVNGLIVTKLDGSARGGVVVSLAENLKLPIYFIGVGEGLEDLQPFSPQEFSRSLMGIE